MLRILTIALIVAFLGSITPALAQATGGSTGKAHMSGHSNKMNKAKKGHKHHHKGGKKHKKGSGGSTVPPPK